VSNPADIPASTPASALAGGKSDADAIAARRRAGATKRRRSRALILAATEQALQDTSYGAAKVEDVATRAGVSPATVYNHFPSKAALVASLFRDRAEHLLSSATVDLQSGLSAIEAIERHLLRVSQFFAANRGIGLALILAVEEQTLLGAAPDAPSDPRSIVPLPASLIELVDAGQRRGELATDPSAVDAGTFITNALMVRLLTRPQEPAATSARLAGTFLLRAMERSDR
jgi:AcrR family transcriptional regulator